MADDDLLNPDDIDALLNQSRGGQPAPTPPASPASKPSSNLLDPSEIQALLSKGAPMDTGAQAGRRAETLLDQAERDLAAAVSPDMGRARGAAPFQFEDFGKNAARGGDKSPMGALQDVELDLRIELGRTELLIEEVLSLKEGSVVPLDKLAGDPVDILVNGRLVARGEVLVLNDNFCVRVAEILAPEF